MVVKNTRYEKLYIQRCDDLLSWAGERLLQHLLWEYFEKKGYEVYGEIGIPSIAGDNRIDLVLVKEDTIVGIEVKRPNPDDSKDENWLDQTNRYINTGAFSDFALIIQYKFNEEYINILSNFGFLYPPKLVYASLKALKSPPYYELSTSETIQIISRYILNKSLLKPIELFDLEFEKRYEPKKKLNLSRNNEITIEHELWKKFRDLGYCILPQVNIEDTKNKKLNEIDLLLKNDKETIAIEVKNESALKQEQIDFYRKVADLGIPVWIVAPQRRLKSIQKMLGKKNVKEFQVYAYESIVGTQKSISDFILDIPR